MGNQAKTIKAAQKIEARTIKGWKYIRLRECVVDIAGTWGEQDNASGLPVLRSTNFRSDGYFDYADIARRAIPAKDIEAKKIKFGDILLERSGGGPEQPVGRVGWCDKTAIGMYFSNFCQLLRPREGLNNKYLFYLLHYFYISKETFKHQQQTTGIRNLDFSSYTTIKLFLPENPKEQGKIAEILSFVDDVIDKTQKTIDQTQTLKKGLMQELFTRGLPGKHEKFKKTKVGNIPASWRVIKIKDCVKINPEQLGVETNSTQIINYLDISAIPETGTVGCHIAYKYCEAPSRARRKAETGDIIVSTVRPYLRAFARLRECPRNFVVSTGFAVLRPINPRDGEFIYQHIINDKFVEFLTPIMVGTNYPAVGAGDVGAYIIAYPDTEKERYTIAETLKCVDDKISHNKKILLGLKDVKSALMQVLLTGKVRVAL